MSPEKAQAYWQENISMIVKLLTLWFAVSFGCGIIFINELKFGVSLEFYINIETIICFQHQTV